MTDFFWFSPILDTLTLHRTRTDGGLVQMKWVLWKVVLTCGIAFRWGKRLPRHFFPEVSGLKLLAMTTTWGGTYPYSRYVRFVLHSN